MNKLIILDWGMFIHRAGYASKNNPSIPVNYTVLNMILSCLRKIGIDPFTQIIIACDSRKNWRKSYDENYKANRKEMREKSGLDWQTMYKEFDELLEQLDKGTDYHIIKLENLEADDIMSSACRYFKDKEIILCTFDSDLEQCWHYDNVKIFSPLKKYKGVKGSYKVKPENFNAYKLLSSKIEKEATDNLVNPILNEKDYENRMVCVAGLTSILTPKGAKEIRHLKIGNKVWSYNFKQELIEPKRIAKIFKNESRERLEIIFCNKKIHSKARKLLITKNHPVFTKKGWKLAGKLKKGDILLRIYDLYNKLKKGVKHVGYKLGYIHGYFAGDGCLHKNKDITISSKDKEGIIRIKSYIYDLLKFDIKLTTTRNKWSKMYNLFIPYYLNILRYYKTGSNYGDAYLKGFIGGFYDAEGSLNKPNNHQWTVSIVNTNQDLILYVYNILKKYNLNPKLHKYERNNLKYKDIYKLDINMILNTFKFFLLFTPAIKRKYPDLSTLSNGYKIKSIKTKKEKKKGRGKSPFINWNLEIEDNNNYFAQGVLVHNCVNLLELPEFIESQIIEEFKKLKMKTGDLDLVPYDTLRTKLGNLYNDTAKIINYEDAVKYEEKKAKRKKVKRRK